MKFQIRANSLITLILVLFISSISAFAQNAPLQGFDDYVNKAIKDWEVPGVAIAVIKDDKIVFAKGYGVREMGKSDKVDENTVFAIGSSSKAFTSAAIAMLVDEKKLKWDDKVTEYLPGFELYDPYVTREMTVRDLLSHRIGLERGDQLWYATDYSREDILRRIRYLEPSSSVRSKFGYQNIMYLAAGQILPSVANKNWDDYMNERIFKPLGMKDTNTSIRLLKGKNNVATPHQTVDDKLQPVAYRLIDNIGPAGSINSNVVDMAQWVRLQLNNGKYDGKQLISAANIKEMQTSQTIMRIEGAYPIIYPDAHFLSYGLGWFLSDFRGKKLVEHGGAIDGMRAEVAMIPEENIGVVILTNAGGTLLPQFLSYRIFDAFMGKEAKDWSGEALAKYKPLLAQAQAAQKKMLDSRVQNTKPSLDLDKYAGDYKSEMYGDVKVMLQNGKLKATFGPNFNGELEHWHYDVFHVIWQDKVQGKGFISFRLNQQGKVAEMNVTGFGDFSRVPEKAADAGK